MAKRILVVDDDLNTCTALALLLRARGHCVDTCDGPEPALDHLRANTYDVLVTDQMMGGMTGLDLARRSVALHSGLRCLIMSGFSAPPADERAHFIWLDKPIDVEALLDEIGP
ncbi:MAG: response regulator [Polyangiaceae bacterium]|jgi:DNA-binding NtrC family response regulator